MSLNNNNNNNDDKNKPYEIIANLKYGSRLGLQNTPIVSQQRGKSSTNEYPGYDMKQTDSEVLVMLELWGMLSTPSLPSTLSRRGSTLQDLIYGSYRTVSHLNCVQTNDLW